jgi:nitrogen-specific signal transduction histidine kinase
MQATHRQAEEILCTLVHSLRQPLGMIETGAYLLTRSLPNVDEATRDQLRSIERQVDRAARLLSEAAEEVVRLRAQRVVRESRSLTNPETASVT